MGEEPVAGMGWLLGPAAAPVAARSRLACARASSRLKRAFSARSRLSCAPFTHCLWHTAFLEVELLSVLQAH